MTPMLATRRSVLGGSLAAAALVLPGASLAAPMQNRSRSTLPSGLATGDVTPRSAVLWSRSDRPGRMVARIRSGRNSRRVTGPWATPHTDGTAKIDLRGLTPGRRYDLEVWFEQADGCRGEVGRGSFSTPGVDRRSRTRFVWTGDTCGQGWGINPDLGGMVAYRAMAGVRPDFFVHSGDTIYSDAPISDRVVEPDGQVWRNLVTPEVAKVAESLDEYRGRYRYNFLDHNLRAMYAHVPVIGQWDDHETHNNWYPGQILEDARYTERRVDVLSARGRRAWQEYMPISDRARLGRGTVGSADRIYRKIERGAHLDLFALDMRSFKGPNTDGREPYETPMLGEEQVQWLIREVRRSTATWKVILNDLPLGLVVPDGPVGQESVSNRNDGAPLGKELELARVLKAFKDHGVRNVVFLTADVHYCAAHEYSPERAAFRDFDPFWEFVAGPISAGAFGPNALDGTFGPRVDFQKFARYANQSPRDQKSMFFGQVDVDPDGRFTVSLVDGTGEVQYTRTLEPARGDGCRR